MAAPRTHVLTRVCPLSVNEAFAIAHSLGSPSCFSRMMMSSLELLMIRQRISGIFSYVSSRKCAGSCLCFCPAHEAHTGPWSVGLCGLASRARRRDVLCVSWQQAAFLPPLAVEPLAGCFSYVASHLPVLPVIPS